MPTSAIVFESRAPSVAERRGFVVLVVLYGVLSVALLPWAREPGLANPRITTVVGTAIVVADLCTALLLAAWYRSSGRAPLLALTCGYLWSGAMVALHVVTFPGATFSQPLFGTEHTAGWLYSAWRGGAATAYLMAVMLEKQRAAVPSPAERDRRLAAGGAIVVAACAVVALLAARVRVGSMADTHWTSANTSLVWLWVALCVAALGLLWIRRGFGDAFYLWLALVLVAAIVDLTLGNVAGGRYTIAWHVSRASMVVSSYLLLAFLVGELAQAQRPSPLATAAAYGAAVGVTLAMVFLRWFLDPWLGTTVPYITLFGAVAISVYLSGWRPSALAACLGYTIIHLLYAVPIGAWSLGGPAQAVQFVLFGFSCALIIGLGEGMRRARDRHRSAEAEARDRAAAVQRARQAAEAAERHASFLSEVAAILGASLDYDRTLAGVARLAIPTLADLCAVDLVEPDGKIRRVATAHVDPAKEALVGDLRAVHGFNPDAPHGVPAVVRTRRPVLVGNATEQDLAIAARNAEQLEMFRTLALKSWIIVPLIARDQVLGALTFVITESARRYTSADLTFVESVANRAAVAIDNARLYREADTARLVAESASAAAHRAQREAEIFGELTAAITASLDLTTVLERVVNGAKELCNADIGRIALRESDTDRMVFRYSAGSRLGTGHPTEVDRANGLGGYVWRTGQPYRTADHRVDPYRHRALAALLEKEGTVASLVVPIHLRDHVEGLIYLDRRSSEPFTERDEQLVRRFADHAAVAIQNAHLLAAEKTARGDAEVANRAKDEFLAVLSHELRTPLNAVYGWARMLRAGDVGDDGRDRALDVIIRNANAQVQLIDDLLDISRVVTGKMRLDLRRVDLKRVVESVLDAVRPAAEAKAIRLETVLDPRAEPVTGDQARLEQVVWNLVMNAVKFTPGGQIEVAVRRVNAHVEIVVSDTGRGIAPDVLPFIFDRFRQGDSSSTRAHGGLGLGLALVKHLVELHGGTVVARSPGQGQGATFVVSLPLTIAESPAAPGDSSQAIAGSFDLPPSARLDGLRILVVDDDRDAIDLASAILADAGAYVKSAASAREAFATVLAWRPDVLVSDIEMPEEDGYMLIRKIRALHKQDGSELPAIALTAYGRPQDRVLALTAGYNMHVRKPVDPAELTTIIAGLVSR